MVYFQTSRNHFKRRPLNIRHHSVTPSDDMSPSSISSLPYATPSRDSSGGFLPDRPEESSLRIREYDSNRGAFDSAKNHKRQRHKRQSVTAIREKSQKPKFA